MPSDDQPPVARSSGVEQRRDDRDRHADRRDAVAAHRRRRAGQARAALDEQREGDDVEHVEEVLVLQEDVARITASRRPPSWPRRRPSAAWACT